ncbi:hypothetical protein ACHAXT_002346 [Thalassiosira profunda]
MSFDEGVLLGSAAGALGGGGEWGGFGFGFIQPKKRKPCMHVNIGSVMYCVACEEEVAPQPDGICLTCGEELSSGPPASSGTTSQQPQHSSAAAPHADDAAAANAMAVLASSMENAAAINPALLQPLVDQLQGAPEQLGGGTNGIEDLAGILPAEALNPQAGGSRHRPVSQRALDNLKRVVLTPQSAELFDAQVTLFEARGFDELAPTLQSAGCLTLNAVPGEFALECSATDAQSNEQKKRPTPRRAALVVCSPRTTKGGKLSDQTMSEIAILRQHRMPFVAYVERGDGITFVQKALVCQRAGEMETDANAESLCTGVIVGNAGGSKEVWPYVMQDNKKEAQKHGLKVPVVMIRREDGARLVEWAKKTDGSGDETRCIPCQLSVHSKEAKSHTCPVCTDSYVPGATIVRLPACGHVFHESCALAWLTKHNTCPYCRREMTTDDEDYERERRRREAQGSDVGGASGDANAHSFYG